MIDATKFDAISFDVYGTILNWEPEIAAFLHDWATVHDLDVGIDELLQAYDHLRQPLQNKRPALRYPEVLAQTLDALAREFNASVAPDVREEFSQIAATHRPFEDSLQAMTDLKSMGFKLAALSNVDEKSFELVTAKAGISFDVVVTAQRVGAYKPDHAHFWAALSDLRAMGIPKKRVLHAAQSRRADIVPTNAIGMTSVWINRPGHRFGRIGHGAENAKPDFETDSLASLVRLLRPA